MNRILTCPHCGPTLTAARLRCDRCGRDLVSVSEAEFSAGPGPASSDGKTPSGSRRFGLWAGVAAAAVAVVALAGLALPGGQPPLAAPDASPLTMAAAAPAPLAPQPRDAARAAAAATADAPSAATRPGDLAQALAHYRAALAEKPADAELLGNVGRILVAMNQPADAVPFLEQAVEAESFAIVARFDLAVAYGRSGKLKEAVEQYEVLARAGAADARVHHNLGLALRQLGRNADAAAAFERAAALEPGRAPIWMGLALSLEAEGRAGEAAGALERYLSLEPAGADADNVRARLARLRAAAATAEAPPESTTGALRR
jgi:tetratricopeptide (TPR) repeat protein